jgi:hypothetical protein
MALVEKNKTLVSVLELKRLLVELRDKRPDICFRYRIVGEMWKGNFMRILQVNENGIALNDELGNKLVFIADLALIMQFEIDAKFQMFEPHCHYDVLPRDVSFIE